MHNMYTLCTNNLPLPTYLLSLNLILKLFLEHHVCKTYSQQPHYIDELEKIFGVSFAENLGPKEAVAEESDNESQSQETEEETVSSKGSESTDLEVEENEPASSSDAEEASEDEPQERLPFTLRVFH